MLLDALGLASNITKMIHAHQLYWGERRLTFETFHDFFPTFPFMMEAQSFFGTMPGPNSWARLSTLMTRFRKTFVFKRYELLTGRYQCLSDPGAKVHKQIPRKLVPVESRGLPLAMVFPWGGIKGGLILHNGEPQTRFDSHFIHGYRDEEGRPVRLVIERYVNWVKVISKQGWTPESPPPAKRKVTKPLHQRGVIVRPWMNQLCGARDAQVLAWLLRVTSPGANRHEQYYRHRRDGEFLIAISCERLADEIGFENEQQVRHALDSLSDLHFITKLLPAKGENRKSYLQINRWDIRLARLELSGQLEEPD
jgi:hypothetical protein